MSGFDFATPGIIILILYIVLPVFYFIKKSKNKTVYLRRINGIDAIDEAVGRSAELGRPVSFSSGLTNVSPTLYACLGALHYIAKKTAVYKSKLLLPQNNPEVLAISEDVVRDAYRSKGKLSNFDSKNTVFLSDEQFAFAAGYSGMVHRENVGTAFLFGYFAAESLILAEAGQQVGAMQVGASVSPEQVAFFICTCDYTLIGEELYATSAYLTRDPIQIGSLCSQDRAKLLFFIFIIVGSLIATANSISSNYNFNFDIKNLDYFINLTFKDIYLFFTNLF